jgi:hypothetical protein
VGDFGNDTGLRGYFMVVVELDVYKKDKDLQNSSTNHAWAGKPNFKKFKRYSQVFPNIFSKFPIRIFSIKLSIRHGP